MILADIPFCGAGLARSRFLCKGFWIMLAGFAEAKYYIGKVLTLISKSSDTTMIEEHLKVNVGVICYSTWLGEIAT